MSRKRTFLVVFFLLLFVFQQAQASAEVSSVMQGIAIQGRKYHYNFQTTELAVGLYTIRVSYNSANGQPAAYAIQLTEGKK